MYTERVCGWYDRRVRRQSYYRVVFIIRVHIKLYLFSTADLRRNERKLSITVVDRPQIRKDLKRRQINTFDKRVRNKNSHANWLRKIILSVSYVIFPVRFCAILHVVVATHSSMCVYVCIFIRFSFYSNFQNILHACLIFKCFVCSVGRGL